MKLSQLTIPGNNGSIEIEAPEGIPSGGLTENSGLIGWIISLFLIAAILTALAFLIYAGFMWMSSGGDKTKIESARKTIIFAVIGLLIAFLSFFIIGIFSTVLDIDLLNIKL